MKCRIVSLGLAIPLLIAGCGNDGNQNGEAVPANNPPSTSPSNSASGSPVEQGQHESIPVTCDTDSPCEGTLRLTEITFGGDCEWGASEFQHGAVPKGRNILQLKGEFDLKSASIGYATLDHPSTIDRDGFTKSVDSFAVCNDSGSGFESWTDSFDAGQKMKVYGSGFVDENSEYLLLNNRKIKLPEKQPMAEAPLTSKTSSETSAPKSSSSSIPSQPVPNTPECVGPAAICGYGTDENGNPNPSSGELQTLHGCEQGYIVDSTLCAAVKEKSERYGW